MTGNRLFMAWAIKVQQTQKIILGKQRNKAGVKNMKMQLRF